MSGVGEKVEAGTPRALVKPHLFEWCFCSVADCRDVLFALLPVLFVE
jgi:hypothetical protein